MRGVAYERWEIDSAIMRGRALLLKEAADDPKMPIDESERAALRVMADKLTAEAREVVRRG